MEATLVDTNTDYYGMKVCIIVPENCNPEEVRKGFDKMMSEMIERANQVSVRDLYDFNQSLQRSLEARMN